MSSEKSLFRNVRGARVGRVSAFVLAAACCAGAPLAAVGDEPDTKVSAPRPRLISAAQRELMRAQISQRSMSLDADGRPQASLCFVADPTPEQFEYIMNTFQALPPPLTTGLTDRYRTAGNVWRGAGLTGSSGAAIATTLTYSFPPDGTTWGDGMNGPVLPNDLTAELSSLFSGNVDRGREFIRQGIASWRKVTGIVYNEIADDGAEYSTAYENVAARGNIRIGANPQGGGGVLAYNYFPGASDMALNSDQFGAGAMGGSGNNYRYLRNVVAHEHGHGLGFIHTVPCDATKLMEPFINTNFEMTQPDEIRGAQRNYGDRYVGNNSGAAARDFGDLTTPSVKSITELNLSTNGTGGPSNTDEDWFRFTTSSAQTVTVTVAPGGGSYTEGQQTSACSGTTGTVNAAQAGNLNVELRNGVNGGTVLQTAAAAASGATETLSAGSLAPGTYWVRVVDAGPNANQTLQLYNMTIRLGASKAPPVAIAGLNKRISAGTTCYFMGGINSYTTDTTGGGAATITTYAWDLNGDGAFEIANSANPTAAYVSNATFPATLRITDSNGLTDTDTINVVVFGATTTVTSLSPSNGNTGQSVPVTINGTNFKGVTLASQVVASGAGVTVTGTPTVNAAGTQITGLSLVINSGAALGARNITVNNSDGQGSSGTGTSVFTVNSGVCVPAGVATSPTNQPGCPGGSASFTVVPSGSAPHGFQWRKGGVNIGGATGSTLTLSPIVAGDAASYDCIVTNGCGSATSAAAALTIGAPASITGQPSSLSRCTGTSASFIVVATGTPTPAYQWRKGGVNIGGANSAILTFATVVAGDAGSYDCVVSTPCGGATSSAAVLTVQNSVVITGNPAPQTACEGSFVGFAVTATGTGPLSYQWRRNGVNVGGFGSTYSINPLTPAHAGNYDCVVTNACGPVTSGSALLTVDANAAVTSGPNPQSVCTGAPASFSITATGFAPLTYQWRKDGVNIGGATSTSYSIAAASAGDVGVYDCLVSNPCGNALSDPASLTLNGAPAITTQPTGSTVCVGAPASFSVVATADDPIAYQWRKGAVNILGATSSTLTIAAAAESDAGSYDCVLTTCSAVTSSPAVLTVNTAPSITTQPSGVSSCTGASITLTVVASGSAPLAYQWRRNTVDVSGATAADYTIPSLVTGDAGSYDCVVTNSCSSVTSAAAVIGVEPGPVITTQPADTGVCEGTPATLSIAASGATSFLWRKGGAPLADGPTGSGSTISGATTAGLTITNCSAADAASYTCDAIAPCGTVTSSAAVVSIAGGPAITTGPAPQTRCLTGSVTFTVAATGGAPLAYQWRKGGVNIAGANGPSLTVNPVTPTSGGAYDVVVTNGCGSATSNAAALAVCAGDFNCSGVVSVQDIFDFLAAYFANNANSDINGSGVISVQDIFDFLAAYFAGCAF